MKLIKIYNKLFIAVIFCSIIKPAVAQMQSAETLQQQFTNYQASNYNEKVFVHTDKTFYIIGESIWFKIYCVDESFNRPSFVSKVAYVEISDKENKPVLQAKIAIDSGSGNGSFIIPSYITSGNYLLRAYTKWMENFSADYFYQQPLTIINNLKPAQSSDTTVKKKYYIGFFPEGGNLVQNIQSTIAFKITDQYGEPVEGSGTLTDNNNSTIASLKTVKNGMGKFSFTPKPGVTYKAYIQLPDTLIKEQLPQVYQQGYVLHLENADEEHAKITVTSNAVSDDVVYMLIHSRNVMKDFRQQKLHSGTTEFVIDESKLPDGISDITVFNSDKQPVCERLYFKKPVAHLTINAQTDKNSYQLRKPVSISLSANAGSSLTAQADMSVSVFMIDSLQTAAYNDIYTYLLLSSELTGTVTDPGYYFTDDKQASEAADVLMLTQGWRRFKWEEVLQNKKPYFMYLPESEGMIINGVVKGRYNSLPASGINTTLTVPGQNFQITGVQSGTSGSLEYNIKNFYGSNNLVVQADSNYTATLESSFADSASSTALPVFKMPLQWKNQLLYRSVNVQAENSYLVNKKQRSYLYNSNDTSLFYGKPFKRYYLDDYTRYITMEEVMREYVAEVHVRKDEQQFHYRVLNAGTKTYFDNDPLVMLDGVPVQNISDIISFDPLKIKRIDVVAGKYYYQNMVSNGIVSYTTYNGDLAGFALNADNIVVKFDGLQREREFYSPVYDSSNRQEAHLPDNRNVLYWAPKVKTIVNGSTSLSFFTSDVPGKYGCVIEGISADGFAGSNIIYFDVSK